MSKELLPHVAQLWVHFSTPVPFAAAVNRKKQAKAKHLGAGAGEGPGELEAHCVLLLRSRANGDPGESGVR